MRAPIPTPLPRTQHTALVSAGLAALAIFTAGAARATLIGIVWRPDGQFVHQATVAPSKFVELCATLFPGSTVRWEFTSDTPMAGNVHFHEGKTVVYAASHDALHEAKGEIVVKQAQDYCWMWTNASKASAKAIVQLYKTSTHSAAAPTKATP